MNSSFTRGWIAVSALLAAGLGCMAATAEQLSEKELEELLSQPCTINECFGINWRSPDFGYVSKLPAFIKDANGATPLHYAARNCVQSSIVFSSLVGNGHEVNAIDPLTGLSPAQVALIVCRSNVLDNLLDLGADPNAVDPNGGGNMLHMALRLEKPASTFKLLAQTEVDLNEVNDEGLTPLVILLANDDIEMVKYLLEEGADPNFSDSAGITAAHYAAANRDEELFRRLMALGADMNAKSADGRTPLHIAVAAGFDSRIGSLFHLAKAEMNPYDNDGRMPIHYSAASATPRELATLLVLGGDPNSLDANGDNPLHYAIKFNPDPKVITALLRLGADPNHKDGNGNLPVFLANGHPSGNVALLELISYGADVDIVDKNGSTMLHQAVIENNSELAQYLLEYGADPYARDVFGVTPVSLYKQFGFEGEAAKYFDQIIQEREQQLEEAKQKLAALQERSQKSRAERAEERELRRQLRLEKKRSKKESEADEDSEPIADLIDQLQSGEGAEALSGLNEELIREVEDRVLSVREQLLQILEESQQRQKDAGGGSS